MAHSNGRIYTETRNGVRYGVTTEDVAAVLGQASLDVGTLCRASNINPWARYKPIPCTLGGGHNVPRALTEAERAAERYGLAEIVDMFTSDNVQQFEDYANSLDLSSHEGGIKMRPWANNGMYYRLSDFVKLSADGSFAVNKGYDHQARSATVTVTKSDTVYQLRPLIPVGDRTVYADGVAQFTYPVDATWLDVYVKYIKGETLAANESVTTSNDEWLSPVDLALANTYSQIVDPNSVRRGVMVFHMDNGVWKYSLKALYGNGVTVLDFNSENGVVASPKYENLSDMTGERLFIDIWYFSSVMQVPILGFAYKVNIVRGSVPTDVVDIIGTIEFLRVASGNSDIYLYFRVNKTAVSGSFTLEDFYTYVQLTWVNTDDETTNENLTSNLVFLDDNSDDNWNFYHCVAINSTTAADTTGTATLSVTKKDGTTASKRFTIQ